MVRHPLKHSEKRSFARRVFAITMLVALLVSVRGTMGQHLAGSHSGSFSGGHVGGFSGEVSTPRSFSRPVGPVSHGFGATSRMSWTPPHYSFVPQRGAYKGYRPSYSTETRHGWDYRGRRRRPYPGYGYSGYPYAYANSWELLPRDLGYSDFTGYGDDNETVESNNRQVQPSSEEREQTQPENEGYRPEYAPAPYRSPASQAAASTPPRNEPPLTLIFMDGHTEIIRNYVLTPSEVIVMDDVASGRVPRIPLSDLNLPATERTAHQAGLDFSPPSA
jgi:hypothetical protein